MGSAEVAIIGKGNARKYMNRLAVGNANDAGIDYRDVARDFGMALFKDDDDYISGIMMTAIPALFFVSFLWVTIFDGWLKIWLAPKVWLLEYAASLVG